jgi:hypothetical protein
MRRGIMVFALVASLACGIAPSAGASAAPTGGRSSGAVGRARIDGRWIDLRSGWGEARACLVYPGRAIECFKSRGGLAARLAGLRAPDLACGSSLDLYDGTYLSGTEVSIYTRGLWINLSTLGFDNRTSSYVVGACPIDLASGTNGGGSRYTRCLSPGCAEFTMASGWNNVVSSVYMH